MITINLNDYQETAEVTIGDHVFKVRRMGAGEELELSASMRRTSEQIEKVSRLQAKFLKIQAKGEENVDEKEISKLIKQMNDATKAMTDEQEYQLESYVRLFDDGGDGSKSRSLLRSLPQEARKQMIYDIFDQQTILNSQKSEEATEEA